MTRDGTTARVADARHRHTVNLVVGGTATDHLAAVRCDVAQPDNVSHWTAPFLLYRLRLCAGPIGGCLRYCHGAKHIGCSRWKGILPQVKKHLQRVYDITNDELDRLESDATAEAQKVSTWIARELDLTYLNHERFVLIRAMMGGRMFGTNELDNCRETGRILNVDRLGDTRVPQLASVRLSS